MLALLCVSISLLAMGGAFRQLIDNGLKEDYLQSIDQSILYISILILIFSVGSFFRSYFINNIAEKIVSQIRQEAYSNIINFDIACFEDLKIGDIISRLNVDIELISKLIVNFLSFFVRNSIMLIGGIILMFYQSPKLAAIVIIIIPLLLLPLIRFGKYVRNLSKNALKSQANITANLEESVSNICAIQAFNQQANKIAAFNKQVSDYLQHAASRLKIRSAFFALAISVILFSITIVIWVGSRDIVQGHLSSGQMISFIYYAIIAGVSSGGIFELLSEVYSSLVASERVFALIDYTSKNQRIANPTNITPNSQTSLREATSVATKQSRKVTGNGLLRRPMPSRNNVNLLGINTNLVSYTNIPVDDYQDNKASSKQKSIEFDNVSFAYPSRLDNLIIDDLSFKIDKGKFIGIVGRSGAGKSTIMQLMLKFYFPEKGIIRIAGQDISRTQDHQIRRMIAYVPQDSSIFSGTIRSNIAFAKPDASIEEIIEAANDAGIMDFVQNLKEGLDTEIGEKGIRLSGGQKQRIAISRAILYNPEILLLDEAMSALDSENEQKLLSRLQEIMKGKTILSIAHRISSIEQADEILLIDHGALIARDTHARLLEKCEIYKIICQEQSINL
ncbi:ABC transporter ATP-binding protein [Candidatus Tisiphia endosymbiont of Hybos culiciformis]|uniref:ABC transporter ATP-binding protein n=1 Tax=Candidatus Tisiphia endosymbiont of Hybos culiciformis TaxID=3139331 RepID=UPI003CCA8CC3